MSTINESTASYASIASEAYGTLVDAMEAANARSLVYLRSACAILARPYASTKIEDVFSDNKQRATDLVSLTLDAAGENSRAVADLARRSAHIAGSAQESYLAALRGIAETGASNMAFMKNAAARMQTHEMQAPNFN